MKKAVLVLFIGLFLTMNSSLWGMGIDPEAERFFKQAEAQFRNKNLKEAESALGEALKIEPDNAVYRYILGQIQYMQKNYLEAKNNLEIVSRSRISQEKGNEYNNKLKNYKKRVKDLQGEMSKEGTQKFQLYQKNKNSPQKLKLAVTLYQAFRLNPGLRYKNLKLLEDVIKIYEDALKASFEGSDWQNGPMLQLAFIYEIANKKDKASEVYMRALDYVEDANDEFIITHKFDYLSRTNKEKLLDTIEAGDFTRKDFEELMGSSDHEIDAKDREKIEEMLNEASERLQNAVSEDDRDRVLEDMKAKILEKQKKGEFKLNDKLQKKLEAEGKTMEEYLKEQGL
jgi:tetratricopeptide (TPR) repeat protein